MYPAGIAYKKAIESNSFKTKMVMLVYFCIYTVIGLLVDIVITNQETLIGGFQALLTFQVIPKATIIMSIIGVVSIFLVMTFGEKFIMAGMDYRVLDPNGDLTKDEALLIDIVEELRIAAGMSKSPKVCMIEADYMNAFATGWTEDNALVAITTKLFYTLNRDEITAVMAHELTHVRNGDVKLTLVVGVLSNIMLLAANIFTRIFMFGKDRKDGAQAAAMILLVLQFVLPLITMALQMFLSRKREYMADAGAVELTRDPEAMANALLKISGDYSDNKEDDENSSLRSAAYIVSGDGWFSTHPSIKNRVESLGFKIQK